MKLRAIAVKVKQNRDVDFTKSKHQYKTKHQYKNVSTIAVPAHFSIDNWQVKKL